MSLAKLTGPHANPEISVVIPTIRSDCWERFWGAWNVLFRKHLCTVYKVTDGETPVCKCIMRRGSPLNEATVDVYTPGSLGLGSVIVAKTPACRNLGFYAAAEAEVKPDVVMTFDDDTVPDGDTIADHLAALDLKVSLDWTSTSSHRMRGFPYAEWEATPVYLSHGYWEKVPDLDAPSQLTMSEAEMLTIKRTVCVVPRGSKFSMCGMAIAFRAEALPYVYYAPAKNLPGAERFDDIWAGLYIKRELDRLGWGVVTGYASVVHTRASNVFKNLRQEAVGIEINETLWKDLDNPPAEHKAFFADYADKRGRWQDIISRALAR